MKRSVLVVWLALLAAAVVAQAAQAKGIAGSAAAGGVTVKGSAYRYTALSPGTPASWRADPVTVIARTDRRGGRVSRWWHLPGRYHVPAVAYDGSAGGLSADGGTLVLGRFSWIYPPRTTGLAILDTGLHLRHPRRGGKRPRHAISLVRLRGGFSFDAISPDGSTIYLLQHLSPLAGDAYRVRALEAKSGELLPGPIPDPAGRPGGRMRGLPISRAASPDGRWAYTLYGSYGGERREPFLYALDTVGRRAVSVDLPQLEGRPSPFLLALGVDRAGRELAVFNRRPSLEGSRRLLSVDTASFEVGEPARLGAGSGADAPWLPVGIVSAALLAAVAWVARARRRAAIDGGAERA